jgi:tetratricopeptide (TPR) repeat protein
MPVRYFNWKLAIVLVISFFVLAVGAVGLRQWHKNNRTRQGLIRGTEAYDAGRWEEAAEYLGHYLAVQRNDVPVLLKYADAQLKIRPSKRNNIYQAVGAYRTILRVDKNNSEAAIKLIEIYLKIGPGEAELEARRQLETNPDPELRRMLALALIARRKYAEAATQLETVLKDHPEEILAYETLGRLVEQRPEDFKVAPVYWFDEAIRNNPSSPLAHVIRAAFYRRNEDVAKALADLETAESMDPSDGDTRLRLAEEFLNCGDLQKAEKHLTAVQKTMPTDQGLWRLWARCALASQSQQMMLKVAEDGLSALSMQPWDFMPLAAELYIRCGRLDDANDVISELSQRGVSPTAVAFLRGSAAAKEGHLREAVKRWQQSMESGNRSPQVRLALASALSRLGDMQAAFLQLRTLISERPDTYEAHLAMAKLSAQSGNWPEAADQARRASELQPENPEPVLVHLQAQIQLLPSRSASQGEALDQMVRNIQAQLAGLKKALGGSGDVELLEFELALRQDKFAQAEAQISQLRQTRLAPEKTILAEVELLTAQSKVDQAMQKLMEAIGQFPESVELVRYLAILSNQQGHPETTEAVLKRALTRAKEPASQRELGLMLVRFYTQWSRQDDAYDLLMTLSQKLPQDILIKRRLLLCSQITKDPERAQKLVDEIKAIEGENGWQWRYEQAKLWFDGNFEKRHPQIISLLQENMLANPNDQASRILLAKSQERAGDIQLALATYREAIRISPDDIRVIIPVLAALFKAKEYDEADRILTRASRRNLSHPELRRWEFLDHLRRGELDSASDILQGLVTDDPNNQAASLSLALLKIQQNDLDEASKLLAGLKSRDPNSLPVAAAQIQVSIQRGDPPEALRLADGMVRKLNNSSARILRARTLASLGRADEAVAELERAAFVDPCSVQVWMAKSDLHRTLGQTERAVSDIRHVLTLDPNNVYVQQRAISLLLMSRDPNAVREGERLLAKALGAHADNIELRLLKARALLAKGTDPAIDEADQILAKITEDQPEISEAWMARGEIAIRRGQPGKAIDAALSGLTYRSNDRGLLLLKARAEAMRSPALALATLRGLRDIDPNDSSIAILLANTYIAADDPEKAVALMTEQLSRAEGPANRQCRITLAVAEYKCGHKDKALKDFDELLQAEPNDPAPALARAQLLKTDRLWGELSRRALDWYEKHPRDSRTLVAMTSGLSANDDAEARQTAESILDTVLRKDPNCTEAIDALAVLLLQTPGRADDAAETYRRLLELEPNNVVAMNNLAWILAEDQGKPHEALELAQKGLAIQPQYADLLDTRGVAYYRLGEYDKAIQDFTRAMQLYLGTAPQTVSTRFHLARAYAKLEQNKDAIEQLNQALALQSRIGGLSPADLDQARRLLKQLEEGR